MNRRNLGQALFRSLSTAWTRNHDGPAWAPWAWTLLLNSLIGLVLTAIGPSRSGGLIDNLVVSNGIGFCIHLLFWGSGTLLNLQIFELPARFRFVFVLAVVLAGSWIGFGLAMLLLVRDPAVVATIMQRASGGLVTFPLMWASIMVVALTLLNRYRARQLQVERALGERARADREAIAARLALLNAQIEPHFLYNTLAHVRALAGRDAQAAQRMIDALIDYLRASSRNMSLSLVPLADEIASVRGYLSVMQQRLGERLVVVWRLSDEALSLPLPPAALQTLVENAIKHGIEPSARGGEIRIEVSREADHWFVDVLNTGAGFGAAGGAAGTRGAAGTGLANLRERLRLTLGDEAQLWLESLPDGTRARLRLAGSSVATPGGSPAPARVSS